MRRHPLVFDAGDVRQRPARFFVLRFGLDDLPRLRLDDDIAPVQVRDLPLLLVGGGGRDPAGRRRDTSTLEAESTASEQCAQGRRQRRRQQRRAKRHAEAEGLGINAFKAATTVPTTRGHEAKAKAAAAALLRTVKPQRAWFRLMSFVTSRSAPFLLKSSWGFSWMTKWMSPASMPGVSSAK